jgi:asparagine synthase (glutamine-hydrolysing)
MAVARLARRYVTVALTGDGGDELFAGYHYYSLVDYLARLQRLPRGSRRVLQAAIGRLPLHSAKLFAGAMNASSTEAIFSYLRGCAKDFSPLLSNDVLRATEPADECFERAGASFAMDLSPAETGMRLDMRFMLPDGYLQKVDVATMAFSLEARCPLVDYRLIEWSMRLPVHFKLRGARRKYLLRKALYRHLPAELVDQPKRGFGVPIAEWLRGPLAGWARDLVNERDLLSRLPLDVARLHELLALHQRGERNAHPVLWAALMLLCFVAHHDRGMQLPMIADRQAA